MQPDVLVRRVNHVWCVVSAAPRCFDPSIQPDVIGCQAKGSTTQSPSFYVQLFGEDILYIAIPPVSTNSPNLVTSMSSLPSNQTVFVWQVPDRDPDRTLERVEHLKKHFSRLDPDMTVTHEPSARIHAGIACTAITLGTSRSLVRDQLPSNFDLRTYRKGAFHWRGLYPTHPLQSSVLLVGNDGSTTHHIQHTLGEFHNLDNDPELFRMSLLTHMVTPPLVEFIEKITTIM